MKKDDGAYQYQWVRSRDIVIGSRWLARHWKGKNEGITAMYFTMDTWAPDPLQKHLGVVSMPCFFYRGASSFLFGSYVHMGPRMNQSTKRPPAPPSPSCGNPMLAFFFRPRYLLCLPFTLGFISVEKGRVKSSDGLAKRRTMYRRVQSVILFPRV
jgi:hypothetical protein